MPRVLALLMLSLFVAAMVVAAWLLLCAGAVAALAPVVTLGGAFAITAAAHILMAIVAMLAIRTLALTAARQRRARMAAHLIARAAATLVRAGKQRRFVAGLLGAFALALLLVLLTTGPKRD